MAIMYNIIKSSIMGVKQSDSVTSSFSFSALEHSTIDLISPWLTPRSPSTGAITSPVRECNESDVP